MAQRLLEIHDSGPPRIPCLVSYGFVENRVRLEHTRVQGRPLSCIAAGLGPSPRRELELDLRRTLAAWREQGFVHGDLSPRNILVENRDGTPRAWMIDWILDLQGFEATPRYAAREVRQGRRSVESDCYAIEKILCNMLGV